MVITYDNNIVAYDDKWIGMVDMPIYTGNYRVSTLGNSVSGIPAFHYDYEYYVVNVPNMPDPVGLPDNYTAYLRRDAYLTILNDDGPDNVTTLVLDSFQSDYCKFTIGDNTFNNVSTLITDDNVPHLKLSIGNNSLNNLNMTLDALDGNQDNAGINIGNNSCKYLNLKLANNELFTLGTNSLKSFSLNNDDEVMFTSKGNIGTDLTIAPIIRPGANLTRLVGPNIKDCIMASAIARGATVSSSGNLTSAGYVINYTVATSSHDQLNWYCEGETQENVQWLNNNKHYFITGLVNTVDVQFVYYG